LFNDIYLTFDTERGIYTCPAGLDDVTGSPIPVRLVLPNPREYRRHREVDGCLLVGFADGAHRVNGLATVTDDGESVILSRLVPHVPSSHKVLLAMRQMSERPTVRKHAIKNDH
jgi:hypothetical protein